ncbi:hypothetical protein [Streptomyces hygroscopicus]|uniref:hypothetical protein n=1 Tax=Streptomyces hygroscopicus TaxID=1912 RepID=UPI000ACA8BC6|nr:hypothetical protein [Streptomyces hygroscopicus]
MMSDASSGAAAQPPRWMPAGDESDLCPAGEWWDAIRVREAIGLRAIELLEEAGHAVGPVILNHEGLEPRLYFLVPVGVASNWNEPGTVALGRTCHVVIPPMSKTSPPGLHWYNLPPGPRVFSEREPLRRALIKARREQRDSAPGSPSEKAERAADASGFPTSIG